MVSASLKINTSAIRDLAKRMGDSSVRQAIKEIPRAKATAALIGQAIADNFDKEGPGWKPTVFKTGSFKILQNSRTLKRSVTTPGAQYNIFQVDDSKVTWGTNLKYAGIHNRGGTISVKNAKMLYIPMTKKGAQVGPIKDKAARKNSKTKYGRDFTFAKSVTIPKREFLVLRPEWKQRLASYMADQYERIINNAIRGGR